MNETAPHPASIVSLPSICEFCDHEHVLKFEESARQAPACPSCGASLADRALAAVLMSFISAEGHVRMTRFLEEKKRRGLVFGALGSPFTGRPVLPDLIDLPLRSAGRSLVAVGRGQKRSYRLPFKDETLDVLVLGGQAGVSLGFEELRRVIKNTGMIVLAHGLRWPLPETSVIGNSREVLSGSESVDLGADVVTLARAAGLLAHIDRPSAGYSVLQRHAVLVMFPAWAPEPS